MPHYKLISKNNRKMYFVGEKKGDEIKYKLVSPTTIEGSIKELLEVNNQFSTPDANMDPEPNETPETPEEARPDLPKVCIFDGAPGEFQRTVNGQIVYLCNQDYYGKTTGEIAQHLRELDVAINSGRV